jgi:tRNA threonylcarbamoyladenosine biosynthesis protein TsaE
MQHTSHSLEETKEIAEKLIRTLERGEKATIWALHGDLGAGKTAFSQAVGEILGVTDTMQSPTFVIEKIYPIEYKGFKHLIHIDAYRLDTETELVTLGWEDIISNPENLILIEWPERVEGIMPKNSQKISFEFVNPGTRNITIHEN